MHLPGRGRTKKPATLSLQIRFETLDDEEALARLIESTVWVSDALAPLAAEAHQAQRFISAFLARWGEAANGKGG